MSDALSVFLLRAFEGLLRLSPSVALVFISIRAIFQDEWVFGFIELVMAVMTLIINVLLIRTNTTRRHLRQQVIRDMRREQMRLFLVEAAAHRAKPITGEANGEGSGS